MILDEVANHVGMGAFHARQLAQMRSLSPGATIGAVLGSILSPGYVGHFIAPTPARLGIYVGGNTYRVVAYIDGIRSSEQARNLIDGYDNSDGGLGTSPYNAWLRSQAAEFLLFWQRTFTTPPEYLDFVGYSAGGALGTYLLHRFKQLGSPPKMKLVTFGAPRATNISVRAFLGGSAICRWMTDADPIPLIPPRATDVPALIAVQPVLTVLRWGNYVHTDGGVALYADGTTSPEVVPPTASLNVSGALAAWIIGQEDAANNPHAITSYIGALDAAVVRANTPAQLQPAGGQGEPRQVDNKAEIKAAQREAAKIVNIQGHAQNAVPQLIPEPMLLKPVRVGLIWCVEFRGRIILQAPIEKRARAIARAGNTFLKSLQKQAIVDVATLEDELSEFLRLAQMPGNGFSPTIKTGLSS